MSSSGPAADQSKDSQKSNLPKGEELTDTSLKKPLLLKRRRRRGSANDSEGEECAPDHNDSDSEGDFHVNSDEEDVLSEGCEELHLNGDTNSSEASDFDDDDLSPERNSALPEISLAEAAALLPKAVVGNIVIDSATETSQRSSPLIANGDAAHLVAKTGAHYVESRPFGEQSIEQQLHELSSFGSLVIVKVLCDWLRCHPNLVVSIGESSVGLWSKLVELLNLLPKEEDVLNYVTSDHKLQRRLQGVVWSPITNWHQKFPLVEDVSLRGLLPLSQVHNTLDYEARFSHEIHVQSIVRCFCLKSFGHFLVRLNIPGLKYDQGRSLFMLPTGQTTVEDLTDLDVEAKREALSKNMAQLRMKGEMEQLKSKGWIPVYIVPDISALTSYLSILKQLVAAQKFIIVISVSVIEQLDELKVNSGSAREAIRYLESEFSKGSRYIRMQKLEELTNLGLVGCYDFTSQLRSIISCCVQLCSSVKDTAASSTIVSLLSGESCVSEYDKLPDLFAESGIKGIAIENISKFNARWQAHRKKCG